MLPAKTLKDARKVLDPRPLDFSGEGVGGASDPSFHVALPEAQMGRIRLPGPIRRLEEKLLSGTPNTKLFLSGHVGSGKSTELNRLMQRDEIKGTFAVVPLRFEEQEWATLDSSQILFRIAVELYSTHAETLKKAQGWKKKLEALNARIFVPMGLAVESGTTSVELSVWLLKIKQDLKVSSKLRAQFREYGETNQSVLQDFLEALVNDIENALAETEGPSELLVVVDDLDKLRNAEQHKDVFDTNIAALLAPPLRILYTVPTAVRFNADVHAEIRNNVEDLFPIRVLRKAPNVWDPEAAFDSERLGFFEDLVARRVDRALVLSDAIRLAAIYSGGVLRDFFRLLREGALLTTYNQLEVLDGTMMQYAIAEERRKESVGLYEPDYSALAHVHQTNRLRSAEDRKYLSLSRVIEAFNGTVWYEANPVLWPVLKEAALRENGGAGDAQG